MTDAYDAHGAAVLDCFRGSADAPLICHHDGARDYVPAAFWLRKTIDPLEALALDLCRGRVLDVGAGTGVHALALQHCGLAVTAIDISPDYVTIMRERGDCDAQTANLYAFAGGPFDTIINLCNGLDKVGHLNHLPNFLDRMRQLLAPHGQLITDSFDLRVGASTARLAEIASKRRAATLAKWLCTSSTKDAKAHRSPFFRSTMRRSLKLLRSAAGLARKLANLAVIIWPGLCPCHDASVTSQHPDANQATFRASGLPVPDQKS